MDLEEQGCGTDGGRGKLPKGISSGGAPLKLCGKENNLTHKLGFINFLGRESGWFCALGVLF